MINRSNELKSLMTPLGYCHSSKAELFADARKGCSIYFWIHNLLYNMWNTSSGHVYFHALDSSRLAPGPSRPNRLVATIAQLLDQHEDFPKIYFSISSRLKVFDTAASLESFLQTSQTKIIDMSSSQAIKRARNQLKECQTSHRKCLRNSVVPALPTRVLDVGLSGDLLIKLHKSDPQQHSYYVALSYCCGGPQKCQTIEDTVGKHYNGIVLRDLSLSIQDAVEVTRQLGFQYLWVDALCIIQDSEKDINAELGLMGTIYKNATLTLAASSAISVEAGFLRKVPAAKHFKLPYQSSEKIFACADVSLMGFSFQYPFKPRAKRPMLLGSQPEPLNTRGWTLQEGLLAPRLLSFGTNGITWKCQSEAITKVPDGVKTSKALPLSVFNKVEKEQTKANMQRHQISIWHSIVEDYTRRMLSVRSDYGRAISGIVSELASCWNDEYLAGMWRRTFVANLAWHVEKDMLWNLEQASIEKGYHAPLEGPSWSWLSKLAKVSFLPVADIKLELVDCLLLHSSKLPYSDFSDGSLTIRAACYEFRYNMGWRQFHYWLNCKAYTDDNVEFHPWPKEDSKTLLDGLLLGFSVGSYVHVEMNHARVTSAKALGRMELILEEIYQLLNERVKGSARTAQSLVSAATSDREEDGTTWALLDRELISEGIPSKYIQQNQDQIREILRSVVQSNNLVGTTSSYSTMISDDISPDGSVSQVVAIGREANESSQIRKSAGKKPTVQVLPLDLRLGG
ncbi:hypothetical protein G7Y89_g1950 [Cudoniella acicularis]|uniref:Heterokaryon incompatibility domain-containing protein n=1 Tax=Cudoniella acicularis TaxID=354080 RepID=A0A8H4RVE5_9HELO|nr:hypothetical protein G7Y89_g1950 [Cudoniella acicularis]